MGETIDHDPADALLRDQLHAIRAEVVEMLIDGDTAGWNDAIRQVLIYLADLESTLQPTTQSPADPPLPTRGT